MRRVRLTFISEFDYRHNQVVQEDIDELVERFIQDPHEFVTPTEDDEVVVISVEDITED